MVHQNIKYSRLQPKEAGAGAGAGAEPAFDFASTFSYDDPASASYDDKFDQRHNYDSAFKYRDAGVRIKMGQGGQNNYQVDPMDADGTVQQETAFWLRVTSFMLTFFSYLFFLLTFPVSYFTLVKKMGEFDRLVVFRLGKMIGVKGPGRFLVFPWMDRTKRIDVRAAAFAVPPQQFITVDGGIVEMGAEIQYGIVDVVTMISEVADHQDILRSLGKTLLVKMLVKKTVSQLERDKRTPETEIVDELNDQVRKWGINVQSVSLSETKVLKQPESGSNTAIGSIMKGLGMKGEAKYPTPQEFVRATHGFEEQPSVSMLGAMAGMGGAGGGAGGGAMSTADTAAVNMQLLQSLSAGAMSGQTNAVQLGPGIVVPPSTVNPEINPANWGRCLEVIVQSEFASGVDEEAYVELEITDTENGAEKYFIDLSSSRRGVFTTPSAGKKPDVSVTIASPDLANVLDGSLAPLQAYLTGRIQASGDVRKLMFLDKLSKRGHKPGSMFNV